MLHPYNLEAQSVQVEIKWRNLKLKYSANQARACVNLKFVHQYGEMFFEKQATLTQQI